MKKEQVIEAIKAQLDPMLWILALARCPLHHPPLESVNHNALLKASHWLQEIEPLFLAARRARRSVGEPVWAHYELAGIDDLQEIILWEETSRALKRACKSPSRPTLFIRCKHDTILIKETK